MLVAFGDSDNRRWAFKNNRPNNEPKRSQLWAKIRTTWAENGPQSSNKTNKGWASVIKQVQLKSKEWTNKGPKKKKAMAQI